MLMKFDPLLAKPNSRLTITKEEDDYIADLELKLPTQEISQSEIKEEQLSANNSAGSQYNLPSLLLPVEDEMSLSVDIMKDISSENNKTSESNHIEHEETKLR